MSLFQNRNFAILFLGQLVSTFGNNLYTLAFPWYIYSLTNSRTDLAIAGFVTITPNIIGLFSGVFIDRLPKKTVMLAADGIRFVLSLVLFGMTIHGTSSTVFLLGLFLLVFLFQGVGMFFNPASNAFLAYIVQKVDLPKAKGLDQSSNGIAGLVGILGGGILIAAFGAPMLFLINALTFFLSVLSLFFIRVKENITKTSGPTRSFLAEWKEGLGVILHNSMILKITLLAVIANFSLSSVDFVIVYWVKGTLHGSARDLGYIFGLFMLGIILGGLSLSSISKRFSSSTIFRTGGIIAGVCISLIGLFSNLYWVLLLNVITGFMIGNINGSIGSTLIQSTPEHVRGRTLSTTFALSSLMAPVGTVVFGATMVYVPISGVFIAIGLFVVIGGCIFVDSKPKPLPNKLTSSS